MEPDEPVTAEELAAWITEASESVERYRRIRRGALQCATHSERRRYLYDLAGVSSINGLDAVARVARDRLAALQRAGDGGAQD